MISDYLEHGLLLCFDTNHTVRKLLSTKITMVIISDSSLVENGGVTTPNVSIIYPPIPLCQAYNYACGLVWAWWEAWGVWGDIWEGG